MAILIKNQIQNVKNFEQLISIPFHGEINAMCWARNLTGDFSEIVKKIEIAENIAETKNGRIV